MLFTEKGGLYRSETEITTIAESFLRMISEARLNKCDPNLSALTDFIEDYRDDIL